MFSLTSSHLFCRRFSFDSINQLNYKDKFYQLEYKKLASFYRFEPTLEGLLQAADARKSYQPDRKLLVEVLSDHYSGVKLNERQKANLKNLSGDQTFTIVTAHQPALFTGPAYYVYKIISAIRLCEELKKTSPLQDFVPVFINGAEDHDFDEVKSTFLFHKEVVWETQQFGAVGRYTVEGLAEAFRKFSEILGNGDYAVRIKETIEFALKDSRTYNDFVFKFINNIFGQYGLLVLNMDDVRLKKAFIPVMEKELTESVSEPLVLETQHALQQIDFKPQAHPREINLFYFTESGGRERIVREGESFRILHTEISYTKNEIIELLHKHPERFSPNVITRPLFQEFILPNIAYIGGGGELAYWLERKSQFEAFNIYFPCLIRRNSVLIIPKNVRKIIEKLGIDADDLFEEEQVFLQKYVYARAEADTETNKEQEALKEIMHQLEQKASLIDPTLVPYVAAEGARMLKSIEHMEQKFHKSIRQKEENTINQIRGLREKLFPGNGLQERKENFMQYASLEGMGLIDELLTHLNPLDKSFVVLFL
jgi:bacillithiol biosynthesis cysteine-adding enzyme BshC